MTTNNDLELGDEPTLQGTPSPFGAALLKRIAELQAFGIEFDVEELIIAVRKEYTI